jgi:hypothetical protein
MCGQSFQQKCSLTRHIAEVHEGKKYVTTVVHKRVA